MEDTVSSQPLLVPIPEAVRILGANRTRIYELIGHGWLDARKQGRRTLVTMASIREYVAALPKAKISARGSNQRLISTAPLEARLPGGAGRRDQ